MEEARIDASKVLAEHPNDHFGLNLMGAILDQLRRFGEAEVYYQNALKLYPNSEGLLNNMASHYLLWGKTEPARSFFLRVLKFHPQQFNANYQLAQLALQSGDATQASVWLNRLGVQDRNRPEVALLRARVLFALKQQTKGRRLLAQLEKAEPNNPVVAFSAGSLYYENRLYRDAERCFAVASRLAPQEFEAQYNLGLAHYHMEELGPAMQAFQSALKLQPSSEDALYHLALVYSRQNQGEQALELLLKAQQLQPKKPEVLLLLGQEYVKQQFFQEAVAALQQYLGLRPDHTEVTRLLGLAFAGLGEWAKAVNQFNQYLEKRPGDAQAYLERALAWKRQLRLTEAAKDLERCLTSNPSSTEALLELGGLELERKNPARAESHFKKILITNPDHPEALYGLGRTYLDLGRANLALPVIEKAVAILPQPAMVYSLSQAYRQLGKNQEASAALRRWQELSQLAFTSQVRARLEHYLSYLRKAVETNPGDLLLKERLAVSLMETGDLGQALTWLEQISQADKSAESQLKMGLLLLQHGHVGEALPYLQRAERESDSARIRLPLAQAYLQAKRYETATKILSNAPPAEAGAADFINLHAHLSYHLGKYKEALEDYQKAIQLAPGTESYYLDLIAFLIDTQAHEAARKALEAAQKIFPRSRKVALADAIQLALGGDAPRAYTRLREMEKLWPVDSLHAMVAGLAASSMDDRTTANQRMEQAVALGSDDPLPYYYLGFLESQSPEANLEVALGWVNLAIAKDPGFPDAYKLQGQLLIKLGQAAQAVASLEQAARLDPESADAFYILGRAYAQLGESLKSTEALQKSEKLRSQVRQKEIGGMAQRQLLVRIQAGP